MHLLFQLKLSWFLRLVGMICTGVDLQFPEHLSPQVSAQAARNRQPTNWRRPNPRPPLYSLLASYEV